ncbi:MAG: ATPase, T2SS/T4P/T4SS family [archaeon]
MRLTLRETCNVINCRAVCLKNCPKQVKEPRLFNCQHCDKEQANCFNYCPNNAIFEASEGILSVDQTKCKGCGICEKKCKNNAITVINGKAVKCDLCAEKDFNASCHKNCNSNNLSLIKTIKDIKTIEKLLGWRTTSITNFRVLTEKNSYRIIEKNNKKFFVLKNVPELSKQEAVLIQNVLNEFKVSASKENLNDFLTDYCEKNLLELEQQQLDYLLKIMLDSVNSFGPLNDLLENELIEEITINGLGEKNVVRLYYQNLGWLKTNLYYCDEKTVKNLVNKMSSKTGRTINLKNPYLNACLEDGSRLNALIDPLTLNSVSVTIRKFKKNPLTLINLIESKTLSLEAASLLWMLMQVDLSVIIAGNTGSGKTTTLNVLLSVTPLDERIIVIEETPELLIPQEHKVKLVTAENLKISMQDLIVNSLRMRPDRIIVSEIRSEKEVKAFFDTLLAGQGKGSFTTFHALSAKECLQRLKSLSVNESDLSSVDLIIVQKRLDKINLKKNKRKEVRRITELSEVTEENGKAKINQLYAYDYKKDSLQKTGLMIKLKKKLLEAFNLNEKELEKELKHREKILEKLLYKNYNLQEFLEVIN